MFRHSLIDNIVSSVCSFAVEPLRSHQPLHQPHHTVVSAERQTSSCDRGGISCCMAFVLRTPITTLLRSSLDSIVAGVGGGVKKSACIVVTRRISRRLAVLDRACCVALRRMTTRTCQFRADFELPFLSPRILATRMREPCYHPGHTQFSISADSNEPDLKVESRKLQERIIADLYIPDM